LLKSNRVTERRRIGFGRHPEPLVPQRHRQLMPSRRWQGMRGIGYAQGAEEIEFTTLATQFHTLLSESLSMLARSTAQPWRYPPVASLPP
jgi:hypothetical protein